MLLTLAMLVILYCQELKNVKQIRRVRERNDQEVPGDNLYRWFQSILQYQAFVREREDAIPQKCLERSDLVGPGEAQ